MPETTKLLASYGRSRGRKLRPKRQELMEELLPKLGIRDWGLGIGEEYPLPNAQSLMPNPLWLEIGFGGGEHLAHQATLHPDTGIIGCEPFINGVAGLLSKLVNSGQRAEKNRQPSTVHCLPNVRIFQGDARLLIEKLPNHCLDKVFILYPDPWPKARHHKRRLISAEFLNDLARVMKPGAELRLATDDEDYLAWMLERLLSHPSFEWTVKSCDDWQKHWLDWISTRYEQKALKAGRVPIYLNFIQKI